MFESRKISGPQVPVVEYEHRDSKTGEMYASPFPVAAFTLEQHPLGVGMVIGRVGSVSEAMLLIEIDDPNAPTGKVHLLSSECWWVPLDDKVLDQLSDSGMIENAVSAYEYANALDISGQASLC